jgi:hypothetical protein
MRDGRVAANHEDVDDDVMEEARAEGRPRIAAAADGSAARVNLADPSSASPATAR